MSSMMILFNRARGAVPVLACAVAALLLPLYAIGQIVSESARTESAATEVKTTATYDKVVVERVFTERTEVVRERKVKPRYVCAIFVKNRAVAVPDKKVLALQDYMIGHVTDKGFTCIAREDVLNKVADFAGAGPNRGDPNAAGAKLDELLSNNTSATRLADSMGADYVLNASITFFGKDKIRYRNPELGLDVQAIKYMLKLSYQLLDATVGGSLTAGVMTVSFTERLQPGDEVVRENLLDELLDAAAKDAASMLERAARADAIAAPPGGADARKEVEFGIHCGIADLNIPEVVKNEKGEYVVTAGRYRVEAMSVTVELDGVVIGTTPGPFKAKPGLHKLRLRRQLFKDWEGIVNIRDGLTLSIAMEMTPQGLEQFLGMARFFNGLKKDQILTDAQAEMLRGYAKQAEQSGIRIEARQMDPDKALRILDDKDRVKVEIKVDPRNRDEEKKD